MSAKHQSTQPKQPKIPHFENSTDATRGLPLGVRAQKRREELQAALDDLPVEDARARNDIEVVLATLDNLLTGDPTHLSDATAAELNRALENSKHLAEVTPVIKTRARG
ncbi:MAG TPA: hypothetical protein VGM90_38025 [Kofleriaceae bacterium]|jgi:hypothetical protein